jgi:hypothetical protein
VNLSAPKMWTFIIAVILWILGLLGVWVPAINGLFAFAGMGAAFWLGMLGGLILAIGNMVEGI